MQFEADRQRAAGNVSTSDSMQAEVDFRNEFPVAIGWAPTASVDLQRRELYPTKEVEAALRRWIMCEQGKLVACIPGAPPPAEVLRPGQIVAGGGGAAGAGGAPPPDTGVVTPADGPQSATPAGSDKRIPWWIWPTAMGAGLLLVLAVGRKKVAR